jgi:hypothetical protein
MEPYQILRIWPQNRILQSRLSRDEMFPEWYCKDFNDLLHAESWLAWTNKQTNFKTFVDPIYRAYNPFFQKREY